MEKINVVNEQTNHYFVPSPSAYPTVLNIGLFFLALGFVLEINSLAFGTPFMLAGALIAIYGAVAWISKIILENETGAYHRWEDRSFRIGMAYFIAAELLFFGAFLGALIYTRAMTLPALGEAKSLWPGFTGAWPSSGPTGKPFTPIEAWGVPAVNALFLLVSAGTAAWARGGLLKNNRGQMTIGLLITFILGAAFFVQQLGEYSHAMSELGVLMSTGTYGTMFYMLTGLHGVHLLIGLIMLAVILARAIIGHFSPEEHFGFDAVSWYWTFVVVAPGLFVFVYLYWI